MRIVRRLLRVLRWGRFDADLAEELDFHRQETQEALARAGLSSERAAHAARRRLGNATLAREEARGVWRSRWIDIVSQTCADLGYALRQCRRRPGLPLVIVLSLGAAMGIGTSMFSVVNAVWLTPWPVPGAEHIRAVLPAISADEWRSWAAETRSFSGLAAQRLDIARLDGHVIQIGVVSANYFNVLEVPMVMGRGFTPGADDAADAGENRTVISDYLWHKRFGGTPNIVGRVITIEPVDRGVDDLSLTVVGVAAPGFDGTDPLRLQLWLPLAVARHLQPDVTTGTAGFPPPRWMAFGRLAPDVSDAQAQAELSLLSRRSRAPQDEPTPVSVRRTDRYSLSPSLPLQTRVLWQSLLVGIVFITAIACANVSNLLLALGQARRTEIALRLALGASRRRVIRQLLTETLALSVAAGGLGLLIAAWLPETLLERLIQGTSVEERIHLTIHVDHRVWLWSFVMSVIACVVFGLAPALRSTEGTLNDALKEGQEQAPRALMPALLSYQTIVSVMALAVAGFMLRSGPVVEARALKAFVADLAVVRLDLSQGLAAPHRRTAVAAIAERLGALADEKEVAGMAESLQVGVSQSVHVTPNYFGVMRLPLVSGRTFASSDLGDRVMVVNEAFARRVWPDRVAVGQTLTARDAGVTNVKAVGLRVVGVVRDGPLSSPTAYLPVDASGVQMLLVRAPRDRVAREAVALSAALRPSVPMDVLSGAEWIAPMVGPSAFMAWLIAGFGGVALLLGTIGYFSLLEYAVQQRTREIGIRRALGAQHRDVVRSVVLRSALPILRGLVLGSAGAACVGVFMRRADLPSGVNPMDALTYAGVAGVLIVSAVAASYGPARHALRIEPQEALRLQ